MEDQPKSGACCSLYFVHSAVFYTVGTLDTAGAQPVTVASFPPISREPAPCSTQVPGRAAQLQASPELLANESITR